MEKVLEEGPLERTFKGSAIAAILDFLIVYKHWDYSKTDIAKNAGVNFRTVLRLLPSLEDMGVVKRTRLVGKAQMYQINLENPVAKAFDDLAFKIAKYDADKIVKEETKREIKIPA
jgi:predicted transcriptional regulator